MFNIQIIATVFRGVRVPIRHALLERDSTSHGINDAGELGQEPISRRLDYPPVMLGDAGLDQLS